MNLILNNFILKSKCSKEGFDKLDHHNPLKKLGPQAINHLKPEHIDYVMQWTGLLQLENCIESSRDNIIAKTSDIWTLSIDERLVFKILFDIMINLFTMYFYFFSEKRGHCIASLKITKSVKEQGNRYYLHTMEKSDKSYKKSFKLTNFSVNCYSVISTNNRNAIATGFVSAITETSIDLLLDR